MKKKNKPSTGIISKLNRQLNKQLEYGFNEGPVPCFTVLSVCETLQKTNEIQTQLGILSGRLGYINKELGKVKGQASDQVLGQIKTKDYLLYHMKRSHDKLFSVRSALKEVLEGKQIIEKTITELKMKNASRADLLLWLMSCPVPKVKGKDFEFLKSYLEDLPSLRQLTAQYETQNSTLKCLAEIVMSISSKSEELFQDFAALQGKLAKKRVVKKGKVSYSKPKEAVVEDFDYYGFSSVAPIVPPLDLNWLNGDDKKTSNKLGSRPPRPVKSFSSTLAAASAGTVPTKTKKKRKKRTQQALPLEESVLTKKNRPKKRSNSTLDLASTIQFATGKFRPLPPLPKKNSSSTSIQKKNKVGPLPKSVPSQELSAKTVNGEIAKDTSSLGTPDKVTTKDKKSVIRRIASFYGQLKSRLSVALRRGNQKIKLADCTSAKCSILHLKADYQA
ncbi:hypothetical protein ScPMuIL_015540 [Solemya velum]